jgi:hypothetical protein
VQVQNADAATPIEVEKLNLPAIGLVQPAR